MKLTTWEPRGLTSLRREMDRLFDTFTGRESGLFTNGDWLPVLDEVETPGELVVKAELPGMDEKDISVTLSGNNLIIKGEKKAEKEEKDKQVHRIERSYGKFERILPLPASVDPKKISADYTKGVLEIHLPKSSEAAAKQIKVTTK